MIHDPKYKRLIWMIIALAALNISMIATILWQISANKPSNTLNPLRSERMNARNTGMMPFLQEQLNLDETQMGRFKELHTTFRHRARENAALLERFRLEMLDELKKENPDTLKLEQIATNIGDTHKQLKINTYQLYSQLKALCYPHQYDALHRTFGRMMQSPQAGKKGEFRRSNENGGRQRNR
jgi:hypothetical protein